MTTPRKSFLKITCALFALTLLPAHAAKAKKDSTKNRVVDTATKTGAAADSGTGNTKTPDLSAATAKTSEAAAVQNPAKDPKLASPIGFSSGDIWNVDIFNQEDHKVLVIQDRKYTKAKRLDLGFHLGKTASSAYLNSFHFGLNTAYHFTEYSGLELFYNKTWGSATAEKRQLKNFLCQYSFCSDKEFLEPTEFMGAAYVWSPIYGKFTFFRSNIIHFDVFATAGISLQKMLSNRVSSGGKNQTLPGTLAGAGVRVFLSKNWSTKLEIRHNAYRAFFAGYGPVGNQSPSETIWRQNFQYSIGAVYTFGVGKQN